MKPTRQNLGNVAIAAVAVLLFAGFVLLATKGGNKDNGKLSAVAPTSTTVPETTTTSRPEETTTSLLETTTTSAVPAATVTTAKPATATTAKRPAATTTTSKAQCASGQTVEASDNKNTFTYDQSGWTGGSSAAQPGNSNFPLDFTLKTSKGAQDPTNVQFTVELTNNTGCTATFANNLAVVVTLHPSGGGEDVQFTVGPDDAHKVTDIKSHETITLKQERALSGSGTFEATGTVQINYG